MCGASPPERSKPTYTLYNVDLETCSHLYTCTDFERNVVKVSPHSLSFLQHSYREPVKGKIAKQTAKKIKTHISLAPLNKMFLSICPTPLTHESEKELAAPYANFSNTKIIYRAAKSSVVGTRLPITLKAGGAVE